MAIQRICIVSLILTAAASFILLVNGIGLPAADRSPPQTVLPGQAPPKPAPKGSADEKPAAQPQAVPLKPAALPGADLEVPKCADSRLTVELFAAAPEIVTPVNICFDKRGRLLVIESHTHFRPAKYDGPKHDRIRILEDTNGDGRADKFSTYFEGTTHTMDIACHPDGTIYLATRNEILKLIDADDDGVAEKSERIIYLGTKGNYPHNGLGGLMFGPDGMLFFGMGENLGEPYSIEFKEEWRTISTINEGGEGGSIYRCTANGYSLKRIATGFWNPFGLTRDIYGNFFAIDNDPDSSPPCRMLHVVPNGNYGFQFRYGRAGKHPFQSWNGELPGTLPMMTGTGESPCEILCYESDGLPDEYRGELFVSTWADHRIEQYTVEPRGASFGATRKPFVQGGKDIRPVGLAVAPDGSMYMSDWVLSNYELHGKGAVWRVKWKDAPPQVRSANPREMLFSKRLVDRENAALVLAESVEGQDFLFDQLQSADVRARAASLARLLLASNFRDRDYEAVAKNEKQPSLQRVAAWAAYAINLSDTVEFLAEKYPEQVRALAITRFPQLTKTTTNEQFIRWAMQSSDPFVLHNLLNAAVTEPAFMGAFMKESFDLESRARGLLIRLLLIRAKYTNKLEAAHTNIIRDSLLSDDPTVKLLAAKWIADDKLAEFRPDLQKLIAAGGLDTRTHWAFATALARLDNRPLSPEFMHDGLYDQLADPKSSVATKIAALRMLPAKHGKVKPPLLHALLADSSDETLKLEVLRVLAERAEPASLGVLRDTVGNDKLPINLRAQALVALAAQPTAEIGLFLKLAEEPQPILRREAIRSLLGLTLSVQQRGQLETLANEFRNQPDKAEELALLNRLLARPFVKNRPAATDTAAWLERLAGPADAAAGGRVFAQTRLVNCARCHKVDGRGADVGQDLSLIGRTEPRWIVESLLQPSSSVAPHYTAWNIETEKGQTFVGLLNHTNYDNVRYIDQTGKPIELTTRDIASSSPSKHSVMPEGLADQLTDQELRDLVAYLRGRK